MERDLVYEENNIAYDCQRPEEDGIKCKNYELCRDVLPKWWFECKGCYECINCLIVGWGNYNLLVAMMNVLCVWNCAAGN